MIKIDEAHIDSLLYEEEGVALDFKKGQYHFIGATDDEKSELLKDVLAFANAWRRTDAFILIGVREIKGGKSEVVGINELLDDAAIQQFVNGKVQRPIEFSYKNVNVGTLTVGVIHIPCQQRPLYLNRDYGKLKCNTVYIRRGSSTDVANVDEIAKMGASFSTLETPVLEVFFAEPSTRKHLGYLSKIKSLVLKIPEQKSIPDYTSERQWPNLMSDSLLRTNPDYYREIALFTASHRLMVPVYIAILNKGNVAAQDVRLEIAVANTAQNVLVMDKRQYPTVPKSEEDPLAHIRQYGRRPQYIFNAKMVGDKWILEARAEKVQPKGTQWFTEPFYIGTKVSQDIELMIDVFADNLQEPHRQKLVLNAESEERTVDLDAIRELEHQRVVATPEFKKFMKSRGFSEDTE
jgi:hypothetical protein